MYNKYKKIKKRTKRSSIIKTKYIFIILIIVIIGISSGYAYWSTNLNIVGKVNASYQEVKLPIEIEPTGENRYTVNASLSVLGEDIFTIIKDEYEGNKITTTMQHKYKQWTSIAYPTLTITLTIPNNTTSDFTNGVIELIDYSDTNNIFQNYSSSIEKQTILVGEKSNVTVTGTLRGNQNVATNTYYNFRITYDVDGIKSYFYYKLIILPIS